jgi:predicted acetyltransferase
VTFGAVDADSPELTTYVEGVALVFKDAVPWTSERLEFRRPVYRRQRLTAARDGDQVVGTFRSWDVGLTVPGGATVRADAVSTVTVRPTHRRRGILTRLITDDLRLAAERGLPVAVLIASEAPIYGRFGFGAATETARWTVDVRGARLQDGVPRSGSVEIVPPARAREVGPEVHARSRRPGALDLEDWWWDTRFGVTPVPGVPTAPLVAAVHRDGTGTPQGFLLYRFEERWDDRVCRTVVHVEELTAATGEAYAALWGLLTELDTVATIDAVERAVDEQLPWLLTDPRAARQASRCDFQWSRLLDVPAALAARSYEARGAVVLEVVDPLGPAAGRYLLEAGDDGAGACTATHRAADVVLPVGVLSSLWLGGGDLRAAATAGLAREETAGALPRLARMLRTTSAPWTPTWF